MNMISDYQKQKERGIKRKYESVLKKGGKCEKCGYDKNLSALEFHHRDPSLKKFQLDSRRFSNTSVKLLSSEIEKCILLCANCHREHHCSLLDITNVQNIVANSQLEGSIDKTYGQQCPICNKTFPKSLGKIFCSSECRRLSKNYPTFAEITDKYQELHSWLKVAKHYNLTEKIIFGIRKHNT